MATPVEFPQQNTVLKAYPGTEAWVSDLPIYRQGLSFAADGQRLDQCVVSCWQLSPEELAEVQRTGVVYFQAFGTTHPPVSVWGTSPFAQPVAQEAEPVYKTEEEAAKGLDVSGYSRKWNEAKNCVAICFVAEGREREVPAFWAAVRKYYLELGGAYSE